MEFRFREKGKGKREKYDNVLSPFTFYLSPFTSKRAFTLIEIMVAVTLFMVITVSAVGSLISINDANKKTQAVRTAIDNINFALDSISRRLRTGKDIMCDSLSTTGDRPTGVLSTAKSCASGASAVAFTAADSLITGGDMGDRIVYRLGVNSEGHKSIQVATQSDPAASFLPYLDMTAPDVEIDELRFIVMGAEAGSQKQPYVLITVRGSVPTGKMHKVAVSGGGNEMQEIVTTFKIQTTVSQRLLNNGI